MERNIEDGLAMVRDSWRARVIELETALLIVIKRTLLDKHHDEHEACGCLACVARRALGPTERWEIEP